MHKKQFLFGLVVAVIIGLVTGGAIVFEDRHNASELAKIEQTTPQQPSSITPAANTNANQPSVTGDTSTGTAQQVQKAYDTYLVAVQPTPDIKKGLAAIKTYLSTDLYKKIIADYQNHIGYDEVLCAQDVPTKITAGSDSQDAKKIYITELFGAAKIVTVNLDDVGKIATISCPEP